MKFGDRFKRRETSLVFLAMYPGDCEICWGRINPGDKAMYDGDDLIHEECYDA